MADQEVTVAAHGQKLEKQAEQLKAQASQLNAQAEQMKVQAEELNTQAGQLTEQAGQLTEQAKQLKVLDSTFKQQLANQHGIENNGIITLRVFYKDGSKEEKKIPVATDMTVKKLKVHLQDQYREGDSIVILNKKDEVAYDDTKEGDMTRWGYDDSRTLSSLGLQDGYKVRCW